MQRIMTLEERQRRDEFFKSRQWQEVRYFVIRRDGARCVACGRTPREDGIQIHVDHIKPISLHWELRANPANLQVLCKDCNRGKSNRDTTDWRAPKQVVKQGEVVLTLAMLMSISGSKSFVALTKKKSEALGEPWPQSSGWLKRLVGKSILESRWLKAVEVARLRDDPKVAEAPKQACQVSLGWVYITKQFVMEHRPVGGFTDAQFKALGFKERPTKKQFKRMFSEPIEQSKWEEFLFVSKQSRHIKPTPSAQNPF